MDSKLVNQAIKRSIRPALREAGFDRFTARTAWRHTPARIDVVNFQSFNSHDAAVLGCTTYSFSINLGCWLESVPYYYPERPVKAAGNQRLPAEYQCQLRGRITRGLDQPEFARRDIWYIDPDGSYLERALDDARSAIMGAALPWFDALRDDREVLRVLTGESAWANRVSSLGLEGSPVRAYLTGYVARHLGLTDLARRSLKLVLASKSFTGIHDRIAADLASLA